MTEGLGEKCLLVQLGPTLTTLAHWTRQLSLHMHASRVSIKIRGRPCVLRCKSSRTSSSLR